MRGYEKARKKSKSCNKDERLRKKVVRLTFDHTLEEEEIQAFAPKTAASLEGTPEGSKNGAYERARREARKKKQKKGRRKRGKRLRSRRVSTLREGKSRCKKITCRKSSPQNLETGGKRCRGGAKNPGFRRLRGRKEETVRSAGNLARIRA